MPAAKGKKLAPAAEADATELSEAYRLRDYLWERLEGVEPGGQTMGLAAIAGQLQKCNGRIAELEAEAAKPEELSIADELAQFKARRDTEGPQKIRRRN